jgi:hypothetical protein
MSLDRPIEKSPEKPLLDYIKPLEDSKEEKYLLAQIHTQGKLSGLKVA